MLGVTDAYRMRHGDRNGLAKRSLSPADDRAARATHLRVLVQQLSALTHVVWCVLGVGTHNNNVAPPCLTNACIHSIGGNTVRIINNPQTRVFCREPLKNVAGAVIGHPVCNDHLKISRRRLLQQN